MKLFAFLKLVTSGQIALMFRLAKTSDGFYRACFVSAALSAGVYDHFTDGKAGLDCLCKKMNAPDSEGLKAWLELGVSLGELKRSGNEYRITGRLSKALLKGDNDAYKALLDEMVKYHYAYVLTAPAMLKEHKLFPFDETAGEVVARSSRISEPFILGAVDAVIPRHGDFQLLEVGCGSAVYIRRACALNPGLRAVGLELQEKVAETARRNIKKWGLEDRVVIHHDDVRNYSSAGKFDLITLHQNIYYFPVAERSALFRHLKDRLRPGGRVLATTLCRGSRSGFQALMDLWVSTTEGYGPLPDPGQLCQQFQEAGYAETKIKSLAPFSGFFAFIAKIGN